MNRLRISVFLLVVATSLSTPTTASAGGVWDPDEAGHRLDIRWVGFYQQPDGRMRITMTFYDRVRMRWFGPRSGNSGAAIDFTDDLSLPRNYFVVLFQNQHHGLSAQLCAAGSSCGPVVGVVRPNAITIRAWVRPLFELSTGFFFQGGSSKEAGCCRIDKTKWGIVS